MPMRETAAAAADEAGAPAPAAAAPVRPRSSVQRVKKEQTPEAAIKHERATASPRTNRRARRSASPSQDIEHQRFTPSASQAPTNIREARMELKAKNRKARRGRDVREIARQYGLFVQQRRGAAAVGAGANAEAKRLASSPAAARAASLDAHHDRLQIEDSQLQQQAPLPGQQLDGSAGPARRGRSRGGKRLREKQARDLAKRSGQAKPARLYAVAYGSGRQASLPGSVGNAGAATDRYARHPSAQDAFDGASFPVQPPPPPPRRTGSADGATGKQPFSASPLSDDMDHDRYRGSPSMSDVSNRGLPTASGAGRRSTFSPQRTGVHNEMMPEDRYARPRRGREGNVQQRAERYDRSLDVPQAAPLGNVRSKRGSSARAAIAEAAGARQAPHYAGNGDWQPIDPNTEPQPRARQARHPQQDAAAVHAVPERYQRCAAGAACAAPRFLFSMFLSAAAG